MILLGPPILTEQSSRNTSMFSLQNMPQSATICALRQYSLWIQVAYSQWTMSYVMSIISWRVRLLCWNHNPSSMDVDWLHLTPATLLWHHQWNPSEIQVSADRVISWPQVLHCIILRSRPMSFRNWITLFTAPGTQLHTAARQTVLHCGCRMRNALWVLPSKRREVREGNRENQKHENGKYDNSDTRW